MRDNPLRVEWFKKDDMAHGMMHVRHGRGSARTYLHGPLELLDFVEQAFGAKTVEKLDSPGGGYHVELEIGDSMIVVEAGGNKDGDIFTKASVYVYVPDVDAAYARALAAGGTSLDEPVDKPYQERSCGVRDMFGNIWWISTYTG